jgi:hypothetical protein
MHTIVVFSVGPDTRVCSVPVLHSQFRWYGVASAAVVAGQGTGLVEPAEQRPVQDVVDAARGGEQGAGEQAADFGQ